MGMAICSSASLQGLVDWHTAANCCNHKQCMLHNKCLTAQYHFYAFNV